MNFLYTCDNNYIWLMIISMISLFNSNKAYEITVYLIGENISQENKELIEEIVNDYKQKCIIIDLPKLDLPEKLYDISRWPRSAYTRLFSAQILPDNLDKVLYLDCDTIIKNDLSELFETDLNDNNIFYGVKDCISNDYKINIGLKPTTNYINAGVLLMNLNLLRKEDICQKINSFLEKYEKFISYADQDVLNAIFSSKIGILKPKYDVMTIEFVYEYKDILKIRNSKEYYSKEEIDEAVRKPYIIHYTTNMLTIRPWYSNSNHPRKEDFNEIFVENKYVKKELTEYKFRGAKNFLLKIMLKLPKFCRYSIIGVVHSKVVPMTKRLKGKNSK